MANSTFDIPVRFDADQAREGVWFDIYDEFEQKWGTFKLAYLDPESPKVKRIQSKLSVLAEKAQGRAKSGELVLEVFLEAALLDWKDVKAGGKEVPFNMKNARAYFAVPEVKNFAYPELLRYCQNVRFYNDKAVEQGVEAVEDKDETLGNS